jgi:hypothetical protein
MTPKRKNMLTDLVLGATILLLLYAIATNSNSIRNLEDRLETVEGMEG